MLRDTEHFSTKLSKIDGFGDAGEFLKGVVKSKEVVVPEESDETGATGGGGQPEESSSSEPSQAEGGES